MNAASTETLVRFWQRHHDLAIDGIAGPETLASIARARYASTTSVLMSRTVSYALADEGRGEQGGNNRGPYVRSLREYAGFPVWLFGAWCGIYASAKIKRAWLSFGYDMMIPVTLSRGARALVRNIKDSPTGRVITVPEPGFALYRRGIGWQGHVRIIVSYDIERDAMTYVAGNENGVVRVRTLSHGEWRKGLIEMVTL